MDTQKTEHRAAGCKALTGKYPAPDEDTVLPAAPSHYLVPKEEKPPVTPMPPAANGWEKTLKAIFKTWEYGECGDLDKLKLHKQVEAWRLKPENAAAWNDLIRQLPPPPQNQSRGSFFLTGFMGYPVLTPPFSPVRSEPGTHLDPMLACYCGLKPGDEDTPLYQSLKRLHEDVLVNWEHTYEGDTRTPLYRLAREIGESMGTVYTLQDAPQQTADGLPLPGMSSYFNQGIAIVVGAHSQTQHTGILILVDKTIKPTTRRLSLSTLDTLFSGCTDTLACLVGRAVYELCRVDGKPIYHQEYFALGATVLHYVMGTGPGVRCGPAVDFSDKEVREHTLDDILNQALTHVLVLAASTTPSLLPKLPPYWPNAKARQLMDEASAQLRSVLYPQALNHEKVCAPSHDVVLAAMKEVVADYYTEGARSLERQLALALGTLYRVNYPPGQ